MEVEKNVCQRLGDQDSTHGLVKEDTLGGILFLRLKTSHLRPKHRLFNCIHYALLTARA
jgi:hypothetical protein